MRTMQRFLITLVLVQLQFSLAICQSTPKDFAVLKGPYLGQKIPGTIPELFAPDLMTSPQGYHTPIIFSPDLNEAIWRPMVREINQLYYSKIENGIWTEPVVLNFGEGFDPLDPFFSYDGKRIYFLSFHPDIPGGVERERIWFVERQKLGWSEPKLIDDIISQHPTHWTFSLARNNNLYFTSEISGSSNQDIYISEYIGGKYQEPEKLDANINSDGKDFTPFIAPDESYLIFARNGVDTKKSDLYISFKNKDGSWSKAIGLGNHINSDKHDLAPYVTPDGKYLFYNSQKEVMNGMHWVSTQIIEKLKKNNQPIRTK